jgi:hypothetical protein
MVGNIETTLLVGRVSTLKSVTVREQFSGVCADRSRDTPVTSEAMTRVRHHEWNATSRQ